MFFIFTRRSKIASQQKISYETVHYLGIKPRKQMRQHIGLNWYKNPEAPNPFPKSSSILISLKGAGIINKFLQNKMQECSKCQNCGTYFSQLSSINSHNECQKLQTKLLTDHL